MSTFIAAGKHACSVLRNTPTTLVGLILVVGSSCTPRVERFPTQRAETNVRDDVLVQFSLVSSLAAGDYTDGAPLRRLLAAGDFGVGTFDYLDGELILLDGKIYQALGDGTVRLANLDGASPFAAVTFFAADNELEHFSAATLDELDQALDEKLPHRNLPYAIRIDGEFPTLTLRSVPAQKPPFAPLVDVVKRQTTLEHKNVRGTLVGLRCPAWIGTLNVAGYHWHFLSDDRHIGGHVLGCELRDGRLRYDQCTSLLIHLPESRAFDDFNAASIDDQDIHRIERQRE